MRIVVEKIVEKIIATLRQNPDGLLLKELAENLGMNRATISKYILLLIDRGIVTERKVGGRAKILRLAEFSKKRREARK